MRKLKDPSKPSSSIAVQKPASTTANAVKKLPAALPTAMNNGNKPVSRQRAKEENKTLDSKKVVKPLNVKKQLTEMKEEKKDGKDGKKKRKY
jgi:hypothetical protein